MTKKTIFAISTPKGKSAIALIRVSGKLAFNINKISSNKKIEANKAFLNNFIDSEGSVIDQTVTTYFKSPKSFTGENMVEICAHGGPAVVRKIINKLSEL